MVGINGGEKMKELIIISLLAVSALVIACDAQQTDEPAEPAESPYKAECESFEGKWIPEANECEGITLEQCESMGGEFDECASACRNDPDTEICTMQCVQVCKLP